MSAMTGGRLPVTVLTGFLGSGKTTLLGALLKRPELSRTAVIVNEFGEIPLDHELVEASDEQIVQLSGGCLCCALRSDLGITLAGLLDRRARGELPRFERIVIETSGLADPAPILHQLMTDPGLASRLAVGRTVTLVDAPTGEATLGRHPEARKQAAMADRLLITKGDVAAERVPALRAALAALNPTAIQADCLHGGIDPALVIGDAEEPERALPESVLLEAGHSDGVGSFAIVRDAPIGAVALLLFLQTLAEICGERLLRVKGIVALAEAPDRPAAIHGVQHVFHEPRWLEGWPSADRRSRLVFITRGVSQAWVETLLAVIEAEAAEAGSGRAH